MEDIIKEILEHKEFLTDQEVNNIIKCGFIYGSSIYCKSFDDIDVALKSDFDINPIIHKCFYYSENYNEEEFRCYYAKFLVNDVVFYLNIMIMHDIWEYDKLKYAHEQMIKIKDSIDLNDKLVRTQLFECFKGIYNLQRHRGNKICT